MNTKYFNKITTLIILFSFLLLGSCKKFLNQQPITAVGTDVVFSDVASARAALVGVYSRLVGDQGFGIRLSLYYTVDNDEMQGPTGASDADRRDIARYAATSTNAQLTNPFNQLFTGIEYANICIYNIPKMGLYTNGTPQQIAQLKRMYGEALTLRAQFYSEAIVNWGDLPSHFLPASVQATSNPFPRRVGTDTLYNQLLDDLKVAENLVPWCDSITAIGDVLDERITKGAVKGLRARIALFRGGYSLRGRPTATMQRNADYLTYYQIARDECNDIINSGKHTLNPSFKSLWRDQVCAHAVTDPQNELMFQASATGFSGVEDTKLGYYDGPAVTNGSTSYGNKSLNILPSYFYLFDSTDLRRDVTIAPYNLVVSGSLLTKTGQAITALNDGKYRRDWSTPAIAIASYGTQYLGYKWQILRYSDVLLMFAEAENQINGPTAAAYNAINQVRRRGYGLPIATPNATVDLSGLSNSDFFTAIVKERSLELGGEGVRKFDLIRWNLLATTITNTKATLLAMSNLTAPYNTLPVKMYYKNASTADDVTLWSNSFYKPAPSSTPTGTTSVVWFGSAINTTALSRFATGFTTGKSELLPIPQPTIDANVNFPQNPGY